MATKNNFTTNFNEDEDSNSEPEEDKIEIIKQLPDEELAH